MLIFLLSQSLNCSAKDFVEAFLEQSIKRNAKKEEINETLQRKPLMLDSVTRRKTKRHRVKMSAREKKERGIYDLSKGEHKYFTFCMKRSHGTKSAMYWMAKECKQSLKQKDHSPSSLAVICHLVWQI